MRRASKSSSRSVCPSVNEHVELVCPSSMNVYRPCMGKRPCLVKCLIASVACSEKDGRLRNIKIKVGLPIHPRMKASLPNGLSRVVLMLKIALPGRNFE
ncbi:hypothetical protein TNCV_3339731 [Trichonephila clavipes]|nr:hypothetical protein TNCV_3339731 [Trichonephila clavipes]